MVAPRYADREGGSFGKDLEGIQVIHRLELDRLLKLLRDAVVGLAVILALHVGLEARATAPGTNHLNLSGLTI
jgi:hypothetical protein